MTICGIFYNVGVYTVHTAGVYITGVINVYTVTQIAHNAVYLAS